MTPPNELEQLAEFQDAIQSNKGLERLRAMQYLQQMNNQGLMGMPQVTEQPVVQRSNGSSIAGGLFEKGYEGNPNEAFNMAEGSSYPYQPQYNPYFDMSGESGDEMGSIRDNENRIEGERQQKEMQQKLQADPNSVENIYKAAEVIVKGGNSEDRLLAQDIYRANREAVQRVIDAIRNNPEERAGGGQVAPDSMAQGLAGLGRNGDSMLLHINPEELEGLASLGNITYNPITGLPEAWSLKSFFKPFKQAAKGIKKVAKSKAFRMLAPLALTIAAPYLAASFFPATFGVGSASLMAGGLSAQVAAMGPIAFGAATAIGSGLGALAGGAKPGDALKAAALSGITAGGMRGFTNYMDPNIKSVYGPTYGSNAAAGTKSLNVAGMAKTGAPSSITGNVNPSYGNPAGVPQPKSYANLSLAGSTEVQPGTIAYDQTPAYGQGGTTQFTPSQAVDTATINPRINNTEIVGNFSPNPNPPVDMSRVTGYEVPNAQFGPPSNAVADAGTGYSQTYAGGDGPNMLQRAGDQLADSQVGRAVSDAGNYVGDIQMGDYNLGEIGGSIVDDYGSGSGLLKAGAIASMNPDYAEQYELEDERKRKQEELERLGYKVELSDAETGFNQTMVIRDPSGTVLPSNLSIQDILDRVYGRTARTNLIDRTSYAPATAKNGGLINLAGGGNFSGMVQGNGHGMEDNVYMPIEEQGQQVGTLAVSPSEYVVDAYTMSALGNGNANQGAKVMDGVVESVRKKAYGTIRQPNEISGLQALKPMMMGV